MNSKIILLMLAFTFFLTNAKAQILEEVEVTKDEYRLIGGAIEQMPQFPGGDRKLMEYLRANLQPIGSLVEGQVIVRFVIDKDSTIKNVEVIRSLSEEADAEAVRIVNSMPKWIPGMNKNRYIPVDFRLPIRFGDAKSKKKNNKR